MLKSFRWIAVGLLATAAAVTPLQAERPPLEEMPQSFQLAFWLNQAALAYNDQDYADWARATEKLHGLRPYNQDFMTHLVKAYAQLGDYSKAFNMMLSMQQQGLAQDWDKIDEVESLRQHNLYEHLNALMKEAGQPHGYASVYATLDSTVPMPESLAFDAASGRLFVGTVREGRIMVSSDGEKWEEFASPRTNDELMAVFDLTVDAQRGHLWVATGAVPQFRGYRSADHGRTALLKLDLDSGEMISVHRVVPDGKARLLGSIAVADDGSVFAADTRAPTIFRLGTEDRHPQVFFSHPNFTSLRGMTLSADNKRLYVADYELGILVVGLEGQNQAWKLAVPESFNEGGIDGLYWWDNHLIVIQNGISPQRIMRLELGEDGLGVVTVGPVAASLPEFDTPTFGVVKGDTLYFLAGSHWDHVDARGRAAGSRLPDVPIMTADLSSVASVVVGQEILQRLLQQQRQQEQQQQQ